MEWKYIDLLILFSLDVWSTLKLWHRSIWLLSGPLPPVMLQERNLQRLSHCRGSDTRTGRLHVPCFQVSNPFSTPGLQEPRRPAWALIPQRIIGSLSPGFAVPFRAIWSPTLLRTKLFMSTPGLEQHTAPRDRAVLSGMELSTDANMLDVGKTLFFFPRWP